MSTDRLAAMEIFVRVNRGRLLFCGCGPARDWANRPSRKTVAQLEDRLGVQLLVRTTRSLTLTDAGRRFHDNAKGAIDGVNLAERVARGEGGVTGTLRVSASICFTRIHVMPRLPEFLAQHPTVDIEMIVDDRFVNLAEERMDLAFRTGRLTDSSLIARKIGQARTRVMASASYWKAHGKPKAPDDLLAHECIILQRDGQLRDEWPFRKGALESSMKTRGRLKSERRRSHAGCRALRDRYLGRFRVALQSRADVGCRRVRPGRLGSAGVGSLGGVPGRSAVSPRRRASSSRSFERCMRLHLHEPPRFSKTSGPTERQFIPWRNGRIPRARLIGGATMIML